MSAPKKGLTLDPEELEFKAPYGGSAQTQILKVTNNCKDNERIAYKVKSSHPDFYRVKNSRAILKPEESLELQVVLLPSFTYNIDNKPNHELVLMLAIADDDKKTEDIKEIFEAVKIPLEQKITLIFKPASEKSL